RRTNALRDAGNPNISSGPQAPGLSDRIRAQGASAGIAKSSLSKADIVTVLTSIIFSVSPEFQSEPSPLVSAQPAPREAPFFAICLRSEERRVGKECSIWASG